MSAVKKDLAYYKANAKEERFYTPISVLRYISELEEAKELEEKQRDEFAIGFAEWVDDLVLNRNTIYCNNTFNQLLEIYKKEKGL